MTYAPETFSTDHLPAETHEPLTTAQKLELLKKESGQRTQRLIEIMRRAFTETTAELKAGRQAIAPLAKDLTAEAVDTAKTKGQQAAEVMGQTWQATEQPQQDFTERSIRFVRAMAQKTAYTAQTSLLPQLKAQAVKLDGWLCDRYSQRYQPWRDRVVAWYEHYLADYLRVEPNNASTTQVTHETELTTVIEVKGEAI